jgi:cell pole-organizing protein PopZ
MFTVMGTKEPEGRRSQLMPSEANNAVHSTWNVLEQTILVENGRTLQDLVREMLRPMLKSWLDDNLPTLVERLVLAEIEEMTGRKPRMTRVSLPRT